MIRLEHVVARRPPLALAPLTAAFDAGATALVGGAADGPALVLDVVAGVLGPRRGRVTVLGTTPDAARRTIAYVPMSPALPQPMRVDEALDLAARLRGEPRRAAEERLAPLGIDALARRAVRSLRPDEARAVAFAEALTSQAKVLLLDEPAAHVDPRAAARIPALVRARAAAGACVLVATGSPRDAAEMATAHLVFAGGALVAFGPGGPPLAFGPAQIAIVATDARRLAAALAVAPEVGSLETEGSRIVVTAAAPTNANTSATATALAAAIARAAVATGVDLVSLEPARAPRAALLPYGAPRPGGSP